MFPTKSCKCLLGGSHSTVPVNSINSPVLSNLDVWGKPYKKFNGIKQTSFVHKKYKKQCLYETNLLPLMYLQPRKKTHTHNLIDLNQCKMNNECFCGQTEKYQRISCLIDFSNPPLGLVHFQHKGCQIRI